MGDRGIREPRLRDDVSRGAGNPFARAKIGSVVLRPGMRLLESFRFFRPGGVPIGTTCILSASFHCEPHETHRPLYSRLSSLLHARNTTPLTVWSISSSCRTETPLTIPRLISSSAAQNRRVSICRAPFLAERTEYKAIYTGASLLCALQGR